MKWWSIAVLCAACGGELAVPPLPEPVEIRDGDQRAAGSIAGQLWQVGDARFRIVTRDGRQRVEPNALASLKVLNVGGGHAFGDAAVKTLVAACPKLQELSLRPGYAGQVLNGYDFDEWEDGSGRDSVYGRLHEHWSIYGNDDIDRMRISDAGWTALAGLPLERVTLGPISEPSHFDDHVTVEVLTHYQIQDLPRIAAWEQYFRC